MSIKDNPLLAEWNHQLEIRLDEMKSHLMNGSCKNHEEYKKITGIIKGIGISKELMEVAIKIYQNDGDEDD